MTERKLLSRRRGRTTHAAPPVVVRTTDTVPGDLAPVQEPGAGPTLFGLPAEAPDEAPEDGAWSTADVAPGSGTGTVVVWRCPDPVAGFLLLVAGTAGGLSLFLPWSGHGEALGSWLVQRGFRLAVDEGVGALPGAGLLLPLAVVLGGGVLVVAGLLAFVPAHTHRTIGVLALFVSLAVAGGVVVRLADAGATADVSAVAADPGLLCALVLAGVALLGALKAMLTAAEVTTDDG